MNPFDKALAFVLRFEGGLSDDPQDSGGLTKFGISQSAFPDKDIRNLTENDAKQIYYEKYWLYCKCPQLPSPLAILLFDCAVNQGPAAAVRILQKSLNVRADGIIGPETIAAGHRAILGLTVADFVARRAYQYALHPQITRYGLGWFRRLSACHQLAMEPL